MNTKAKQLILKSKDWKSFKKNLSITCYTPKDKGDAFELIVKLYLQTNVLYKNLKNVWLLNEVPTKILKHLNLPNDDMGIDLIAKTKEGEYWSIQAKYRHNVGSTITHGHISTFASLSFTIGKNISYGLVCQTTERYSKLYKGIYQIGFRTNEIWEELGEAEFKEFHSLLRNPNWSKKVKPFKPKPHQKRAIRNAKKHYLVDGNTRGKLIFPCGSGKSLTGYWIAKELKAKTILVCVPSLNLINQTLNTWTREVFAHKQNVDWICVCSDQSVKNLDDQVVYTQDLGIQVNTNVDKIQKWLSKKGDNIKVVFTTYQSGNVIAEAARKAKLTFDVGIYDEAHKTVGRKDKLFSYLIFDKNIKVKRRVFMTATERRYKGSSDEILSMDNYNWYGDTFEIMSFKEAIEQKEPILCDYKIATIFINESEYEKFLNDNIYVKPQKGKWNDEIEMKSLTSLIALRKGVNKYPITHAITFHNSIAKAKAFQESNEVINQTYPIFKEIDTFHVTGKTNTSKRSKILRDFARSKRAIITNARCLTEGIDIKNVDCVLFADAKKSTVDIVQAVGRALRISEGKKYGYVILPIQTYEEENQLKINDDSFQEIINVLRALASNDNRIIEWFGDRKKKKKGRGNLIEIEIDEKLREIIDVEKFKESIELKIWNKLGKLNWMQFSKAKMFVHRLKLKSQNEWFEYCKNKTSHTNPLPINIPTNPSRVYKNQGWKSFGDWLGTGTIAPFNMEFLAFKEARNFVRSLNLKSQNEWRKYCKGEFKFLNIKPNTIPSSPQKTYKNKGWNGYGDWLGTGTIASRSIKYLSFEEAKKFVHSLNLKSGTEWKKYCKGELPNLPLKPNTIPVKAYRTYKDKGWNGMGDWLGTGTIAPSKRIYLPFEKARKFVQSLNLNSNTEWRKYCKGKLPNIPPLPDNIPATPSRVYKNQGWEGFGDWLGTGTIAPFNKEFLPFKKAREFVHSLNLKSVSEWRKYCKGEFPNLPPLPNDIPISPRHQYKNNDWKGMGDWLGTETIATHKRKYLSFKKARKFAQSLNLKSSSEWKKYCKGGFPNLPHLPFNIPTSAHRTYKDMGWQGYGDWLGTGTIAPHKRVYLPFVQARKFVHSLNLKSQNEWRKYCKGEFPNLPPLPQNIPVSPYNKYKDNKDWKGFGDWLGK